MECWRGGGEQSTPELGSAALRDRIFTPMKVLRAAAPPAFQIELTAAAQRELCGTRSRVAPAAAAVKAAGCFGAPPSPLSTTRTEPPRLLLPLARPGCAGVFVFGRVILVEQRRAMTHTPRGGATFL